MKPISFRWWVVHKNINNNIFILSALLIVNLIIIIKYSDSEKTYFSIPKNIIQQIKKENYGKIIEIKNVIKKENYYGSCEYDIYREFTIKKNIITDKGYNILMQEILHPYKELPPSILKVEKLKEDI